MPYLRKGTSIFISLALTGNFTHLIQYRIKKRVVYLGLTVVI